MIKKILMFATEFPPAKGFGLARYASELATALAKQNHEVHVITCNYNGGQTGYHKNSVYIHDLKEIIPLKHYEWVGDTILNNALMLERALEITEQDGSFDLIISHDWLASQTAKSLKSIIKCPWVLIMHDTEPGKRQAKLTPHQRYIAEMEAWSLSHADCIVTTSKFMVNELNRLYKVPSKRIKIISCGVNPERFQSETNISDFRNLFVREGESLIFYAGRLSPMKGVEYLLEAFRIIISEEINARLVIAGDGVLRKPLEKRAKESDLRNRILFTGTLSDKVLGAFYRAADCVVVPSRYEPFGMVAIEAAACGAKVIAAEVGGLKELIRKSDGNIIGVPPGNPQKLADHICNSMYGSRTGAFNASDFLWEKTADSMIDLIQKFLNKSGRVSL